VNANCTSSHNVPSSNKKSWGWSKYPSALPNLVGCSTMICSAMSPRSPTCRHPCCKRVHHVRPSSSCRQTYLLDISSRFVYCPRIVDIDKG
jgi:hypothetical protein